MEENIVKNLIGLDKNKCYLLLVERYCLSDEQMYEYAELFKQAGQAVIIGSVYDISKIRIVEIDKKAYTLIEKKDKG